MENRNKTNKLEESLKELGINDIASLNIEIVHYSDVDEQENKQIYKKANKTLLSIMYDRKPANCIHITGEMRALADPLHRSVCRKISEKYNSRFEMVGYLPPERRTMGRKILEWNRQNWEDTQWMDHLDAFDLLGDAKVNLYALSQQEKRNYSVFADKYILLQAKHSPGTHTKEVWLLESRTLNKILVSKAKRIISKAKYIRPHVFKELTLSISSPIVLHILFSIYDMGETKKEELYSFLKDVRLFQESYMEDLKAVGFIQESNSFIKITKQGKDYLSYLKSAKLPISGPVAIELGTAQEMLISLEQKVCEGRLLSFEDISKIKKTVDLFDASHSYSTLDIISQILDKDIEARKRRAVRDPIAVLNDYSNIAIGIYHKRYFGKVKEKAYDKAGTLTRPIYEKMRAIIFNEFDRLSDIIEQKFLSGEIRREGYLQEMNKYYRLACSYWPK